MAAPEGADPRDRLRRELGLRDALFLVVASVVGSGIFLTPGPIAERLPHPGLIFAVWIVGGLLSLAGALANAELGAMFPRAGGDYVWLREAFHPLAGFAAGWLTFFAIFTGTIASLAAGFAEGLVAVLALPAGWGLPLALGAIAGVSALNVVGVRMGARANNATTWVKVAALLAFGVAAPLTGRGELGNLRPLAEGALEAAGPLAFALALSPVLFSYLGWNATVYVASELRDPDRVLPRSLFGGLAICTGLYLLLNAVYLYALPVHRLGDAANAGEAAALALFGPVAGGVVAGFVLVSILGTLNATVLVGPRIAYAMALDGLGLPGVERVHAAYGTPTGAIALQALVSAGLLLALRTFPSALDFTTFAIVVATIADTAALFVLRRRRPGARRPYRALGYPFLPGLYGVLNVALAGGLALGRPREAGLALAVMVAALPAYLLLRRRRA